MIRWAPFPLLTSGLVVVGALLAPASASAIPSATAARTFVDTAQTELEAADLLVNRAGWVRATDITVDTDAVLETAEAQRARLTATLAAQAAAYDRSPLDPTLRRQLDLLKLLVDLPAPNRPGGAEALAALSGHLGAAFATGSFSFRGKLVNLKDAQALLATARDPAESRDLWEGWRAIAPPERGSYANLVTVANEGARDLGFHDVGALWRAGYDMPPEAFEAEVARLWAQMSPLYTNLHCYVRGRLNARYGDAAQPRHGPIRADLLGNMWGQDWSQIDDLVVPQDAGRNFDLTRALVRHGYTPLTIVKAAEGFYTSLGLKPLPDSFWQRSLLVRPTDRKVDCNASAWTVGDPQDVRVKGCLRVSADDWYVAHHELGHDHYQLAYADQPFLFRDGVNRGFHEAIGDFIALSSTTPAYLEQLGLETASEAEGDPIPGLLRNALAKVPLMAFAITLDGWRWRVFDGEIAPADYESSWQSNVQHIQGMMSPRPRPADAFDAFAKYHVAAGIPYSSYFMALIYEYQFQRAACRIAGFKGPLSQCSIYGSKAVGARLDAMLRLGRSKPTADALEIFTGQREADASGMAEYFAPLSRWLEQQNRGESCGWE